MNPASIDIKDIMVSELGFEFGVDLFISSQPDTPMNCVTIFDVSTTPPEGSIDGNDVFLYESIMMWIRNSSYEAAYQQAQAIIVEFHNKSKFIQNGTYYLYMNLQSGPNTLAATGEGGEQDYSEFSLNFNLMRKSGASAPSNFLTFAALVQALVEGTNITLTVDEEAETITINSIGGSSTVTWDDVQDKPSTFPPSAHTQAIDTITGLTDVLNGKQPTLVSGTDIKTINGDSILGSGDIVIEGGGALVDLSDVDATDIGNDKILVYNSTTEKHEYQAKPTSGGGLRRSETFYAPSYISYLAFAPDGSLETDAVWTITKRIGSVDGTIVSNVQYENKKWTERNLL